MGRNSMPVLLYSVLYIRGKGQLAFKNSSFIIQKQGSRLFLFIMGKATPPPPPISSLYSWDGTEASPAVFPAAWTAAILIICIRRCVYCSWKIVLSTNIFEAVAREVIFGPPPPARRCRHRFLGCLMTCRLLMPLFCFPRSCFPLPFSLFFHL